MTNPNAEENYADLLTKVPWAKRVHGIEGSRRGTQGMC